MDRPASEPPAGARAALARYIATPTGTITSSLLSVQVILALVVVLSRMAGGQQLYALLVMAVIALAHLLAILWLNGFPERFLADGRPARSPSGSDTSDPFGRQGRSIMRASAGRPERLPDVAHDSELGAEAALALVADLEEIPDHLRHLPFNVTVGFDEDQYVYTLVKLRAALRTLTPERARKTSEAAGRPAGADASAALSSNAATPPAAAEPHDAGAPGVGSLTDGNVEVPGEAIAPAPGPPPIPEIEAWAYEEAPAAEPVAPAEPPPEGSRTEPIVQRPDSASANFATPEIEEAPAHRPQEAIVLSVGGPEYGPAVAPAVEPQMITIADEIAAARQALRGGDAAAAAAMLRQAMAAEPSSAEAAELLGIALEQAGDRTSALSALRTATEMDPGRASAHYNLAVVLSKEGRADEASLQAAIALDLKPEYSAARQFYERLGADRG